MHFDLSFSKRILLFSSKYIHNFVANNIVFYLLKTLGNNHCVVLLHWVAICIPFLYIYSIQFLWTCSIIYIWIIYMALEQTYMHYVVLITIDHTCSTWLQTYMWLHGLYQQLVITVNINNIILLSVLNNDTNHSKATHAQNSTIWPTFYKFYEALNSVSLNNYFSSCRLVFHAYVKWINIFFFLPVKGPLLY